MTKHFEKLFNPGYIGNMKLKNRIVKAATETTYANRDGTVSERMLRFYKELALGGSGLVIVEMTYIDKKASEYAISTPGITDIHYLPGLSLLAQTIQENGAKAALQLYHGGAARTEPSIKAPSPIPWAEAFEELGFAGIPEELTIREIEEIIEAFGDSALRAKMAGYDMLEIHAAHGYLITQFLSMRTNKRTDWYGGNLENRMRFLLQVVSNVRKKIGSDFPVSVRLSGSEYIEGGITIEETIQVAKALEKTGVDTLHISGGCREAGERLCTPMYIPEGINVWAAEAIKKVVSIPVIVCGAINTPELAEQILEEGKADFISMGRQSFADPYWANKAKEGRVEDIIPCIRCNEGCLNHDRKGWGGLRCTVNVAIGKEDEFRIKRAEQPKKVAVIGGGPAGMEAARVAALSGHQVTLFEKRKLGGHLNEAGIPEFKKDIRRLVQYLITQVKKAGVNIVEEEAKAKHITRGKFDIVILATGSVPLMPNVTGVDKPIVIGALDVLNGAETGNNVIVVGGGLIGCEVSLFLAEKGRKVTIVEMLGEVGYGFEFLTRQYVLGRLSKNNVQIFANSKLEAILDDGVVVTNEYGVERELKGDSVVLAVGLSPVAWNGFDKVSAKVEVRAIGDCVEPRLIFDAIHDGHLAARNI